jgi:hypothetical protein
MTERTKREKRIKRTGPPSAKVFEANDEQPPVTRPREVIPRPAPTEEEIAEFHLHYESIKAAHRRAG